jgi:hypothetical protein
MALRYTGEDTKHAQELQVKTKIVNFLRSLCQALPRDELPLFEWGPRALELRDGLLAKMEVAPVFPHPDVSTLPLAISKEDSEVASSSSESSDEASVEEATQEHDFDTVEWVTPALPFTAKLHRVHPSKEAAVGGPRPVCCDLRLRPDCGIGLAAAASSFPGRTWCPRCAGDIAAFLAEVKSL